MAGDLNRPDSLSTALDGVRGVFLLPGYSDMPGLLAAIAQAGVKRVVLLSGGSAASGDERNAVSAYMIRSEAAVQDSGLPWTILRPSGFMSNTLQWVAQLQAGNLVRAAFANVRVAMIDPADIAAVAAKGLLGSGDADELHRITGPESLLPADRVRILAEVLGRELHFEAQTDADARVEMAATMPVDYVDAFFDFYVGGALDESPVLPTVHEILARPPRTFEQWATAHAAAFG
ncbi:MAG: NAD(P)H-binding protein [Pseudonocardiaceae bacterium]